MRQGSDTPASTRIRENQRRSRNRKKELIDDLQKRLQEYEKKGVAATLEMQRAARRVAHENAGLRSLLARHGVSEGEIADHLRSFSDAQSPSNVSAGVVVAPALVQGRTPVRSPGPGVSAVRLHGQGQLVDQRTLHESNAQQPAPILAPTTTVRRPVDHEPQSESDMQIDESTSAVAKHLSDVENNDHSASHADHVPVPEEQECPNTADCFCPPTIKIHNQALSPGLEISCEAAASIIVDMRGDGDFDSARALLGCTGPEECNVKNSTVLQIMDEG